MERHTRQILSVMLIFSLTVAVVFNFALGASAMSNDLTAARNASMGFLWSTILLAGTLGLNRTMNAEQENNALEGILISPIDRSAIYLGKVLSTSLFTMIVEAILLPIFIVFFNRPFWRPPVWGVVILGTLGFVAAGILVASMTSQTRGSSVLLPVLLLPLSLPSVMAAATAAAAFMLDQPPAWSDVAFPVSLVVAFDVLMLTAGFLTYHFVVEE
ncbi:MAG: heme exporter protein CcmB [Ardenticatenales bacterium]|nr:heme exporter protein CcmB [Ardenticatenales bacterium]